MSSGKIKLRKHLNSDSLFKTLRSGFANIEDHRVKNITISLADVLMSGFAMFSLKSPSLLAFDENRKTTDKNLKTIYKIDHIPCDTQMRTILDEVKPESVSPLYKKLFKPLQRGKVLEKLVFMDGCYLLSLDGTGYFSSSTTHCDSCMEKKNSKTGEITYYHQMLGAAIIHPDFKEVIPLAPEPIIKQDGETKNDCERNASKRFFKKLRKDHPHLNFIVTEDGLGSNAPHIRELVKYGLHYILGAKKGDHSFLFNYVESMKKTGDITEVEYKIKGVTHRFNFVNQIPLNESNQDILVNFIEYWEITENKIKYFTWVTDLLVTKDNVFKIMRGARSRWKIENETFNTLKNQGYHFEHNFGHGKKNLSVVLVLLMMLAFLVDQIQQLTCPLFQGAWKKQGSKRSLWEKMRGLFHNLEFDSMTTLLKAMFYGYKVQGLVILEDSS